jgi:hypothetical protein
VFVLNNIKCSREVDNTLPNLLLSESTLLSVLQFFIFFYYYLFIKSDGFINSIASRLECVQPKLTISEQDS